MLEITVKVWTVTEGKIKRLKYNDSIYIYNEGATIGRTPVILNYIKELKKEVFTLDEFFEQHPSSKYKDRKDVTIRTISELITNGKLLQLSNNKFKVCKE